MYYIILIMNRVKYYYIIIKVIKNLHNPKSIIAYNFNTTVTVLAIKNVSKSFDQ